MENEVNIEKHLEINHPEQKLLESEYLIIALDKVSCGSLKSMS